MPRLSFPHDRRGVAVIEFALILPLIAIVLFGMLGYAQHFLLAHAAQQIANDAARATVGGMDTAERRALADVSVARARQRMPEVARYPITANLIDESDAATVAVRLDATSMPLASMTFLPMPEPLIERRALVLHGGD